MLPGGNPSQISYPDTAIGSAWERALQNRATATSQPDAPPCAPTKDGHVEPVGAPGPQSQRIESATHPHGMLSAAVLIGGESRRMGRDKALLRLGPEAPPLAKLVIDRVSAAADDVILVGPSRPGYAALGAPIVPDRLPGAGPLGGVATALTAVKHDFCLVVACDMPFLSPVLLRWMVDRPRDYDVLIPRCTVRSLQGEVMMWQTLHAIYAKTCLPAIERRLARGQRSVRGLLEEVQVEIIDEAELRNLDPTLESWNNVNTPEALAAARRRWQDRGRYGAADHLY